jgi:PAS domain-containing protein
MLVQFDPSTLELRDVARLVVGVFAGVGIIVAASYAVWQRVIKPLREKLHATRTLRREVAFHHFEIRWLQDHFDKPIFIFDDRQRCVWVNDALTRLLQVDSSDVRGRGWHTVIKDSELSRVLQKWDEAYQHQSPYVNVSVLMTGRKEKRILITADPFCWKGKVANYIGTMELLDDGER